MLVERPQLGEVVDLARAAHVGHGRNSVSCTMGRNSADVENRNGSRASRSSNSASATVAVVPAKAHAPAPSLALFCRRKRGPAALSW